MAKKGRISLRTKFLSNHHYLNEVPVERKVSNRFYFQTGQFDQYAAQIIRTGNCITLLNNHFEIAEDSFWNTDHFENTSRYIFFTFNKSFLVTPSTREAAKGTAESCSDNKPVKNSYSALRLSTGFDAAALIDW